SFVGVRAAPLAVDKTRFRNDDPARATSRKGVRDEPIRSVFFAPAKSLCPVRQADRAAGMGGSERRPYLLSLALLGLRLSLRGHRLRARRASSADRRLSGRTPILL